ncbi:phosphonate metabolism protein/1,5-bisphosphokinase (PRPP-forming) PhnN [Ancylobacter dichloromethanicus]|uniref:Ribose 1,5-bisphosphate phosphokinase PhnN n=1 Tax=Ancylobacter dichloromethanicus TaxID=518825 RepID=A0A9W6MZV9_9HYPH|nr:phosphonate metabolism protein/1,5-bisphosphokinase (PRPP-forming) PhnN [Ancylobacter dichloromethanicus]MBS7553493.1 phosphonate metabolism protein/1,5-bisphosphokinase (PRPP-forming) PhnN [Ancylobacter dichloromethanicus]GLK72551.1 ribose 1,5-bisphosphate phosphokinase PhnN [Ancylobacter dichloromethanicus]
MNEKATIEAAAPGPKLGPGLLVLVVGPSGAGKDTLLAYARERLAGRDDIRFARRRITRPADATEDHVSVDAAAFALAVELGRFPLHWQANGLSYALGEEVAQDIAHGRIVVANGSRAAVPEARARFARVKLVHVTAPTEILAARIAARGRESADEVLARLKREPPLDGPPDLRILNVDGVDAAGERLAAFLRGL